MANKKKILLDDAVSAKASLSEIFAAMSGIVHLGIGCSEFFDVSGRMALFSYDLKTALFQAKPSQKEEVFEDAAQKALRKLQSVQPLLLEHANEVLMSPPKGKMGSKAITQKRGGTALDVFTHIASILEREAQPNAVRAEEKLDEGGSFTDPYKAEYLPDNYKPKKEPKKQDDAKAKPVPSYDKRPQPAFV
ncbi:MAG: hypothetical protein DI626_10925 [Micavibrio aeruginosavorus]|uniref:Uncharacterized protein n=1 Tax=Micavibrio aeruginosavorus TaxID=349221 RepID=A0A2W4ZMP8_9BACT|nr:MAG: hypothetical protein DI626_10925 [Micavibrio aeruginosavorus]